MKWKKRKLCRNVYYIFKENNREGSRKMKETLKDDIHKSGVQETKKREIDR